MSTRINPFYKTYGVSKFRNDKKVLVKFLTDRGIRVAEWLANPFEDEELGYYSEIDSIILISPHLRPRKKEYISTLIHEAGHVVDYSIRGYDAHDNSPTGVLVSEYLASVQGLFLIGFLNLKLHSEFYIKSSNESLTEHLNTIKENLEDKDCFDSIVSDSLNNTKKHLDYLKFPINIEVEQLLIH